MTHPSSRTATARFNGRRLYLPRRSSRVPTNSWWPFDRAVPSPHAHYLCWRTGTMDRWECAAFADWLQQTLA